MKTCLHCDLLPPDFPSPLCPNCKSVKGIPRLYLRRRDWNPAWEQRLLLLTFRAKQRLPLFPEGQP